MTLATICGEVYKIFPFDKILIMIRANVKDANDKIFAKDCLFGYCYVIKKMSGYAIDAVDDDIYNMSDEFENWEYDPEEPMIIVWYDLKVKKEGGDTDEKDSAK